MAIKLPDNPTPEQFEQAEPVLVRGILEESYGRIKPLKRVDGEPKANEFQRIAPGEYKGIFMPPQGATQFAFEIGNSGVSYLPLNPETIDSEEDEGEEELAFNERLEFVSQRTRELVFHRGGCDALEELFAGLVA